MTELEQLPPDQRAALSLLLRRRERYEQVAGTLGIAPGAVRDRAHAALAALAPTQARALDARTREQIGELLLGQQDGAQAAATKARLAASEPARAWAAALAAELAKIAPEALRQIPVAPSPPAVVGAGSAGGDPREAREQPPVSKRGGAILLAGLLAAVAVAVALVLGLGGKGGSGSASQAASRSGGGAAQSSKSGAGTEAGGGGPTQIEKVAELKPVAGGSAQGAAAIASEDGRRALILNALRLPATNGFSYVVWLIGAHGETTPFGRTPAVGRDGRVRAVELLTVNPGSVSGVEISRETSLRPHAPGTVVLRGSFVSR